MSWKLYVYAPTEGVESVTVYYVDPSTTSITFITTVSPQGSSTPCFSDMAVTDGYTAMVMLTLADNASVTQWVKNVDGVVSYDTTGNYFTGHSQGTEGGSAVYIRAEVYVAQTYYATMVFDANGGTGAPSSVSGSNTGSSTVTLTIPGTIPTWSGYTFEGWQVTYSSGSTVYQPGGTANLEGTTSGIVYTAYAVWTKEDPGGGAWLCLSSGWVKGTKYIYTSSGWKKDVPYVVTDSGWKKGV